MLGAAPYAFPSISPSVGQLMFWAGVAGLVIYPVFLFWKSDVLRRLLSGWRLRVPWERNLVRPWEVGKKQCSHQRFVVDDKKAEVECADCNEKLNPMWVLTYLCNRESTWQEARKRYQEEMARLAERERTKCQYCGKMTRISRN